MKKIFILSVVLFFAVAIKGFSQTVYASEKGTKYHTADCRLSGDAKDMTLAAAKKKEEKLPAVSANQKITSKTKQHSALVKLPMALNASA